MWQLLPLLVLVFVSTNGDASLQLHIKPSPWLESIRQQLQIDDDQLIDNALTTEPPPRAPFDIDRRHRLISKSQPT